LLSLSSYGNTSTPMYLYYYLATKDTLVLSICRYLGGWFYLGNILGSNVVIGLISKQWCIRDFIFCTNSVYYCFYCEGTLAIIKLVIIIVLYLFDPDCKSTIKNIIPNIKSIFSNSPDKIEAGEEWYFYFYKNAPFYKRNIQENTFSNMI
jgi:hypothetical protein